MRARLVGTAMFVCALAWATPSQASSLTFTFDCTIYNTSPTPTCTAPNGPFGSLKLTDSSIDSKRVDVFLELLSPPLTGVTGLDHFYLNYNNGPAIGGSSNNVLGLVSASALPGNHTPAGSTGIQIDSLGPYGTTLDVSFDPNLNPGLTFLGSIVVYSNLSGHAEEDLNVSMFNYTDGDNLLYAAFNTLPENQQQQYGALTSVYVETQNQPAALPEPGTLTLLGSALLGLGARIRRQRRG